MRHQESFEIEKEEEFIFPTDYRERTHQENVIEFKIDDAIHYLALLIEKTKLFDQEINKLLEKINKDLDFIFHWLEIKSLEVKIEEGCYFQDRLGNFLTSGGAFLEKLFKKPNDKLYSERALGNFNALNIFLSKCCSDEKYLINCLTYPDPKDSPKQPTIH